MLENVNFVKLISRFIFLVLVVLMIFGVYSQHALKGLGNWRQLGAPVSHFLPNILQKFLKF